MAISVRAAQKEDQASIVDFQVQLAAESEGLKLDVLRVTQGVGHIFDCPQEGHYYVAVDNRKIVACLLVLKEWSDWRARHVWWIHSVFVQKEYRRQGIFSSMYNELKVQVNARADVAGLRLYVDKTNLAGIETYRKLGMSSQHYHLFEWLKND